MTGINIHIKKLLVSIVLLFATISLNAQDTLMRSYYKQQEAEYRRWMDSITQNYNEFQRKADEDYARFMREEWESFKVFAGEPQPLLPEPNRPYERDKTVDESEMLAPIPAKPIPLPDTLHIGATERPEIQLTPSLTVPEFMFGSYGTLFTVRLDFNSKFILPDAKQNSVADAWDRLATPAIYILLNDLLSIKSQYSLGDWAYYRLIRDFSDEYVGKDTNESVVMQAYLLIHSGYDARIGSDNDHIYVFMPFDGHLFNTPSIEIDKERFYVLNSSKKSKTERYKIFNKRYDKNDRVMSLKMNRTPQYDYIPTNSRRFVSKRYPDMSVDITVNKNLIDFYNEYPHCDLPFYCWGGLSEDIKEVLYPQIRNSIAGLGQIDAANRIINFVQTAFEYKTDANQFGAERSFFADENFYYPYNDCEDRAILFAILVHDILDLDVVLVKYPNHVATAVNYTEPLNGRYLTYEGNNYYISDPTYIGSRVGECIPKYSKESPEFYELY